MEAEYDEVLHWEVPGPVEPGESSMAPETPWGGGYPVGRCYSTTGGGGRKQTPSLMAGSYGFQSQEELLRMQKYLKDHEVWQLKQVS